MNKVVCVAGLCGAGKSVVSDFLVDERGYQFLRFGQITLDEVKRRGLEPNEILERQIREEIRGKYGMGAYAILNLPKFEELIKLGNVVGDGLYSFEEYKIMREHFGSQFKVIAVYAPPKLRYERISHRIMGKGDTNLRNRPLTRESAEARDIAEIEKLNKGGTIAMADYTIVNIRDKDYLLNQLNEIIDDIEKGKS